jgi:multisubunit Na+/H+ antiporter MnhB subunit
MSPVAAPDEVYRAVTRLFAVIILGFGLAILVVTLANGGGPLSTGFLLGVVFVVLGSGRLYLAMRGRR